MIRVVIEFKTDNAAFDEDKLIESKRIIQHATDQILEEDLYSGFLFDINGNKVGEWSYEDTEEE